MSVKNANTSSNPRLLAEVKSKAVLVGRKTMMELLAKCTNNNQLKPLVETMIDIMK